MKPKKQRGLEPRLRFPEFRNAPEWSKRQLNQIAKPVSGKAKDKNENILTLSGEHGIVLQSEYFGKKIAGENVARYIRVSLNDFVYNDRTTKLSTYGSIKRLSKYESGIVSPIYKCFRFNSGENPVFWEWYFESGFHEAQLHTLVNEGARAGRFNISIDKFLSTLVWSPEPSEQQKIADFLSSLDDLIAAQTDKLDTLKDHKKGLLQQLFPAAGETLPQLRFPEFQDAGEWEEKKLLEVCEINPSNEGLPESFVYIDLESVVTGELIYNKKMYRDDAPSRAQRLLKSGDVIYQTVRPYQRNNFFCDFDSENNYVASTGYAQLRAFDVSKFLYQLIHTDTFVNQVIAKCTGTNYPAINSTELAEISVVIPKPLEQQKIADILSSLDALIALQTQKLAALTAHKKGLLQQLFPSPEEAQS